MLCGTLHKTYTNFSFKSLIFAIFGFSEKSLSNFIIVYIMKISFFYKSI